MNMSEHDWCPGLLDGTPRSTRPSRQTRSAASLLLFVPRLTTDFARRSFSYTAHVTWNSLPTEVMLCDSEQF